MPPSARGVFADRLDLAQRYVGWLAGAGTVRGLIGPREIARLWERHVLNSAVIEELIPEAAHVADIGSGAGLPGLVLAIRRPDLSITLIEPLLRRTTFLDEVVADLGLDNVEVVRGRAEDPALLAVRAESFDVVTSRAVAPMRRLAQWSLPLVRTGGLFLPIKGSSASDELVEAESALTALGANGGEVVRVGADAVDEAVTVVRIIKLGPGRLPGRTRPDRRRPGNRKTRREGGR